MSGSICDDEFATFGIEIPVSHINGNTLLTLSLQTIHQQGQINLLTLRTPALTVSLHGRHVIFKNLLRVVQQAANQRTLAVIDTATGYEAQQALGFLASDKVPNLAGLHGNSRH